MAVLTEKQVILPESREHSLKVDKILKGEHPLTSQTINRIRLATSQKNTKILCEESND